MLAISMQNCEGFAFDAFSATSWGPALKLEGHFYAAQLEPSMNLGLDCRLLLEKTKSSHQRHSKPSNDYSVNCSSLKFPFDLGFAYYCLLL